MNKTLFEMLANLLYDICKGLLLADILALVFGKVELISLVSAVLVYIAVMAFSISLYIKELIGENNDGT